MRCIACDVLLSDEESCQKSVQTGEYLDLCFKCLREINVPTFSGDFKGNNSEDTRNYPLPQDGDF